MNILQLPIESFLEKSINNLLIDVRSPAEFIKGHIPGAVNIPLFDDKERAEIGTIYKHEGRETSVIRGFEITSPKLSSFLKKIIALKNEKNCEEVMIHCWRGGLRSQSFAWMLNIAGIKNSILQSGYKAYRNYVLSMFKKKYKIILLSGETGCGKTDILKEMKLKGEQIIDLEGLAGHKGSVFGGIGREIQPTTQQFENNLAKKLVDLDENKWIWVENESPRIGRIQIPNEYVKQMKSAPVFQISIPIKDRTERIIREYGSFKAELLEKQILRLKKYIGNEKYKIAVEGLSNNKMLDTVHILLNYYDKTYEHYLNKYNNKVSCFLEFKHDSPQKNAGDIISTAKTQLFN